MIRLMLASYSTQERETLAQLLESAQNQIERTIGCQAKLSVNCRDCRMRHICTDLLAASVFAKDYTPSNDKPAKV